MINTYFDKKKEFKEYNLEELISCFYGKSFIGRSAIYHDYAIYLVTYDRVIKLDSDLHSWNKGDATFYVREWVDLDIYTISKED